MINGASISANGNTFLFFVERTQGNLYF